MRILIFLLGFPLISVASLGKTDSLPLKGYLLKCEAQESTSAISKFKGKLRGKFEFSGSQISPDEADLEFKFVSHENEFLNFTLGNRKIIDRDFKRNDSFQCKGFILRDDLAKRIAPYSYDASTYSWVYLCGKNEIVNESMAKDVVQNIGHIIDPLIEAGDLFFSKIKFGPTKYGYEMSVSLDQFSGFHMVNCKTE